MQVSGHGIVAAACLVRRVMIATGDNTPSGDEIPLL
jgi:hypothetical protein